MATSLSCEPYHGMRNPNVSTLQNMKAEAVPPEVTKGEILELANMHRLDPDVKLPLHDDIMQLARLGEVAPVRKLFEDGKVKPDFQDDQGITPLHVCVSSMNGVAVETKLILVGSDQQPFCAL